MMVKFVCTFACQKYTSFICTYTTLFACQKYTSLAEGGTGTRQVSIGAQKQTYATTVPM